MISSRPDWQWFGSLSENELAEAVQDNPNVHWIQNAYAWIKDRQSQGPSRGYVPFLTVNVNGGQLGFLNIDEKPIYGKQSASSEFERHASRRTDATQQSGRCRKHDGHCRNFFVLYVSVGTSCAMLCLLRTPLILLMVFVRCYATTGLLFEYQGSHTKYSATES